jgi:hypothetical protein
LAARRASLPLLVVVLGGFEPFEVIPVPWPLAGTLHLEQVSQGADANDESAKINLGRLLVELRIGGNLRETLQDIDLPEVGADEGSIPGSQEGANRIGLEKAAARVHSPAQLAQQRLEPLEIVRIRIRDQVDIPSAAKVAPGVDGQPAHENESDLGVGKPLKQLAQPQRF